MFGSCRSAAQLLICLAENQIYMCICIPELGYDPASQLVRSLCRQVLSVSLSRQESPCGWDAKNNKCVFVPWVTWAMGGHSLAFKGLRRLCPWWHAIYDLVNPFLIILLWQRWKYPTSNDWLYWYAAICASVEEQSHKSNKLEKPLFSSEREILSGWEQETWCKGISAPRRGSLWSAVKSPFLLTRHIYGAPTYSAACSPPTRARLIAWGWSLGTEEEFLSAFTDVGLTAVKCLWLCGCWYWLVIYHICTERMIRKHILGQKKAF